MFDEKQTVYQIVTDYWKVFKYDCDRIGNTEEWLQSVAERYSRHAMEYKQGPVAQFASDISLAFLSEIEKLYKQQKGE